MLYQAGKGVTNPFGQPILDENQKPVSFALMMFTALIANLKTDQALSVSQKRDIYKLKQRLAAAEMQVELSVDDVKIIKDRVAAALSIDLFGQIDEFLDNPIVLHEVPKTAAS